MEKKIFSPLAVILVFGLIAADGAFAQTTTIQQLGETLYFDQNLSLNGNQSCASCHNPASGFVDPRDTMANAISQEITYFPVSIGSEDGVAPNGGPLYGGLNAPSAAYAAFSPFFHWDGQQGLYVGGQFWNGRANTLAEQAGGPFLNPVEMAMPDKWAVIDRLKHSAENDYVVMFQEVFGLDLSAIQDYNWSAGPVPDNMFPPGVMEAYDRTTIAIGEFEKTPVFTKFDSKFDYFLAGMVALTPEEEKGMKLFNGKAKCHLCHLSAPTLSPDGVNMVPPVFTDFTYDNLGLPQNLYIPGQPIDQGLGGRADIAALDPNGLQIGKHKVMTLRNIDLTQPYGHNGVFQSLEQIVHFYNTRDVLPACDPALGNTDPGFGVSCWPAPEVPQNVNAVELGNLSLQPKQEAAVVAFLKTLSDGWGSANGMPVLPQPILPSFP